MRRLVGLALAPLFACGSSAPPVARAPAATPTASDPTPVATSSTLRGTLLGHDGKPMKMAHVSIGDRHVQVGSDGSFEVPDVAPGFARVAFTGVDHGDHTAGILFREPVVEVDVVLGTYERPATYATPQVVQIVFADDGDISLGKVVPMTAAADGTFVAEVPAAPGAFAYELRGVVTDPGRSMNGTDATQYRYDGDGNYASVVTVTEGPVRVSFDPNAVLPSGVETRVTFAQPDGTAARVAQVYAEMAASERDEPDGWQAAYRARIAAEQDDDVRRAMLIAYFGRGGEPDGAEDAALAAQVLADIPATSPLWSMGSGAIGRATGAAADRDAARAYVDEAVSAISDPVRGGELLFGMMWIAHMDRRYDDVDHYYKMMAERFPNSPFARPASMFDPNKAVRPGAKVPDFDLASFDDSGTRFSPAAFEGKTVLIEFWATWCKPCVEEMPNLHAMHDKYKGEGFTILSISADDKADAVRSFRKAKFPMPWHNVVLVGDEAEAAKSSFEVAALPTQILVGPDGVIVGYGPELRGNNLESVIQRALGAK